MKRVFFFILVLSVCLSLGSAGALMASAEDGDSNIIDILYINSYHDGYKWSDDIYQSVLSVFDSSSYNVDIDVIYLDTQQLSVSDNQDYLNNHAGIIEAKHKCKSFDLIMTSDDAAYRFVNDYLSFIDDDVPVIFGGVNDVDYGSRVNGRPVGGIIEYMDAGETIDLMVDVQPNVTTIHYLVDDTLTGRSIEANWLEDFGAYPELTFSKIQGDDLEDIQGQLAELPENDLILLGIYFYDESGQFYAYDEGVTSITEAASVPVYGMWDFQLRNGILGGKLLSGIDQGSYMAEMAVDYFNDGVQALEVQDENQNKTVFDYAVMKAFGIETDRLPAKVDIINFSLYERKNILLLHSYNEEFQWTSQINQGMVEILDQYGGNVEVFSEYMDLKRVSDPLIDYNFHSFFDKRYSDKRFDLILTSDDAAFNFARQYLQGTEETPIVFCGVNYLEDQQISIHETYTGIMEAYDIAGTLDSIIRLQPDVRKILVVNDQTLTGLGNNKNVEAIEEDYPELEFQYLQAMTMNELIAAMGNLTEDTAVLLMTFNRDRANNTFSYNQAIEIIRGYTNVPMYGVWDFYLGNGIVGGYLTDASAQGRQAAELGIRILEGDSPADIPVITESPNYYKFDMEELRIYQLDSGRLPSDSIVINGSESIIDVYRRNPNLFNIIMLVLFFGVIVIAVLFHYLRRNMRLNKENWTLAHYDRMTGVMNRESGIEELKSIITDPTKKGQFVTIYFFDINELKFVNDVFGHKEGDVYIRTVVTAIANQLFGEGIFCRMGGDEFMVVRLSERRVINDDFPSSVKQELRKMTIADRKEYSYSVSVGFYQTEVMEKLNLSDIIERADKKMYRDKQIYRQLKNKEVKK